MKANSTNRVTGSARRPGRALLAGWLMPGAGHWYLGLRGKAIVFGVCLLALFAAGVVLGWLGHGRAINPVVHHWLFIGQACAGPVSLVGWLVGQGMGAGAAHIAPRLIDLGVAFTVTAGALNVVVLCDVYARAAHLKREGRSARES